MADIPLIFVYRETVKQELAGWFGKYYDNIETAVSYNLVRNAVSMVQNGVGAAICYVLDDEYKGVKTIPLSPPLEAGAVLAWKKEQPSSAACSEFIQEVRKCISGMPDDTI